MPHPSRRELNLLILRTALVALPVFVVLLIGILIGGFVALVAWIVRAPIEQRDRWLNDVSEVTVDIVCGLLGIPQERHE